jgi:Secretion system C-terminal sorting domain/Outer membrane protein Omp28
MKYLIVFAALLFIITSTISAQESRKVLVEVFTNSHCPLCPAAHNAVENFLAGSNGDKISYLFYHMVYPYSDDSLYYQSKVGSDARNIYYNPVTATPQGWFDGTHQGSASGWDATLNNLVATDSPLKIILSGTRNTTQFNINAQLMRTGDIPDNDLVIHFVVAENLYYAGRNGITHHIHVMRKMFPTPEGQPFSIASNETKNIPQTIDLEPLWDADSLCVVAFVQSTGSKTVYQSETINYNDLTVTGLNETENLPTDFILQQNYPNPFNPTTKISWQSPVSSWQTLKVYDVLGSEVKTLVNEYKPAGKYEISFNATNLPSGVYYYQLSAGNYFETKKMILLR